MKMVKCHLFLCCGIEHGDRRLLSKRQLESTAPVQVPPPKRTATSTWSTPTPREAPPKVEVKCLGAVDMGAFKENPGQGNRVAFVWVNDSPKRPQTALVTFRIHPHYVWWIKLL